MNVIATKDYGCFYKGDEIPFTVFLFRSEDANRWPIPVGATVTVGIAGDDAPVWTTNVVIVDQNGQIAVTYTSAESALLKTGQPMIVILVTKDEAAWTFEIRAPFNLKTRSLAS